MKLSAFTLVPYEPCFHSPVLLFVTQRKMGTIHKSLQAGKSCLLPLEVIVVHETLNMIKAHHQDQTDVCILLWYSVYYDIVEQL